MTEAQAIERAAQLGPDHIARPYDKDEEGVWIGWGVTTRDNNIIPPATPKVKGFDYPGVAFRAYQKRFVEH